MFVIGISLFLVEIIMVLGIWVIFSLDSFIVVVMLILAGDSMVLEVIIRLFV